MPAFKHNQVKAVVEIIDGLTQGVTNRNPAAYTLHHVSKTEKDSLAQKKLAATTAMYGEEFINSMATCYGTFDKIKNLWSILLSSKFLECGLITVSNPVTGLRYEIDTELNVKEIGFTNPRLLVAKTPY